MAYKTGEPSWGWRRYMILSVVAVSLGTIILMKDAADTMINRTIVEGMFMLVMAFGLGYAGFATAQDISAIISTKSGLPYREDNNVPPA